MSQSVRESRWLLVVSADLRAGSGSASSRASALEGRLDLAGAERRQREQHAVLPILGHIDLAQRHHGHLHEHPVLETVHDLAAVTRDAQHVLAAHAPDLRIVTAGLHQQHHVGLERCGLVRHQPWPLVHGGADRVATMMWIGEALAANEAAQLGIDLSRRAAGADVVEGVFKGGLRSPEQPLETGAGRPAQVVPQELPQ